MKKMTQTLRLLAVGVGLALLLPAQGWAQKKNSPSSIFKQAQRPTTAGDGYMVAGDYWNTVKPMNTDEGNGVEDPLRGEDLLHWITFGPDGTNWLNPNGLWPGGYDLTQHWRDGTRIVFPVFENDGWTAPLRPGDTADDRFMFAYFGPNVPGADDPNRNYKRPAQFTDESRTHLVYEAGWPTTAGLDFKIRAHQYTSNEQNLNDFVVMEISMTNTGVVDANADGTPELTDHVLDAVAATAWTTPAIAVRVTQTSGRSNRFGAGRTFGYLGAPESGNPHPLFVWYANVPPSRTDGRTLPAPGANLIGVNDGRVLEGYTDVWNGYTWIGAKEGAIVDGDLGALVSAPDKLTVFGTPPVGEGAERGWYTSMTNQDPSLFSFNRSELAFRSATATFYEDYGKATTDIDKNMAPNSALFGGGTADDVTTFGAANAGVRPNGDFKYGSEDVSKEAAVQQPVWEPELNNGGSPYDDVIGFTQEYTFGQSPNYGMGPIGLDVGESVTIVFVATAGFRFNGLSDAVSAADWAWRNGWDVSADLPTPPAPDVKVESTQDGTALIRWTDVSGIGNIDGYKIWRASQFKREKWTDVGFRVVDAYHHQHEPGPDNSAHLELINPNFDAESEFTGDTQNFYQPAGWGPYELIEKIPVGNVSQFNDASGGYQFSYEDANAITGFTYWYYVSAYKDGSFTGPQGAVSAGHIESSSFTRNGRNSPDAADGELGLGTPWGDTYPFAIRAADFPVAGTQQAKNIGGPFTVTPPVAAANQVADLITVTPNPYKITGLNDVRNNPSSHSIDFLNLPADYTLTILDTSGQIVFQTVSEEAVDGKFTWDLFSKDGIEVASGLYIYHVEYSGQSVTGHFSILR